MKRFQPIKNAALLFAPLRVEHTEDGMYQIWTRRDERPGTLGNFVLAQTQQPEEARLFAAAPQLLRAAHLALEILSISEVHFAAVGQCGESSLDEIRAALKAATGGAA